MENRSLSMEINIPQVKHLYLVAGMAGAGKTHLLEKIQRGELHQLCLQMCMTTPYFYLFINATHLKHLPQQPINQLVVHYDFYSRKSEKHGFDFLHMLLSRSKSVTVMTLCVKQQVLLQRNASRLDDLSELTHSAQEDNQEYVKANQQRLQKQRTFYDDNSNIIKLYQKWFEFIQDYKVQDHLLLDTSTLPLPHAQHEDTYRSDFLHSLAS